MAHFTYNDKDSLMDFLFTSNEHDALLDVFSYDITEKKLIIEATNHITMTKLILKFFGVHKIIIDNKNSWCDDSTINSITLEDYDSTPAAIKVNTSEKHLCFAVELISLCEIYILTSECDFSQMQL